MLAQVLPAVAAEDTPGVADPAALITAVIDNYESHDTCRLEFTQETYWSLADTVFVAQGVLLLRRPLSLSVRYDDGSAIASDGDSLQVYTAATNQFFVTRVDSSDVVIDPARLLRQYAPDARRAPVAGPGVLTTVSMVRKDGAGEPARLEVEVDRSKLLVTGLIAHARSGDHTRYVIRGTTFGIETRASDFRISIPAGAERMGGAGMGVR